MLMSRLVYPASLWVVGLRIRIVDPVQLEVMKVSTRGPIIKHYVKISGPHLVPLSHEFRRLWIIYSDQLEAMKVLTRGSITSLCQCILPRLNGGFIGVVLKWSPSHGVAGMRFASHRKLWQSAPRSSIVLCTVYFRVPFNNSKASMPA